MPDVRKGHYTYPPGPSLMNIPTPPYNGPGASLYGSQGPRRSELDYRRSAGHAADGPPQSLADHVDQCLDRVKGLGPKQRLTLHNELLRLLRDVEVIRLVAAQGHGPHSDAAAGIPMDQGRPL
jgi:hypothetical protein